MVKRELKALKVEDKSKVFIVSNISSHYGDTIRLNGSEFSTYEAAEKYIKSLQWYGDYVIFSYVKYNISKHLVLEENTPLRKWAVFYKEYSTRWYGGHQRPFNYLYCGVVEGYDLKDAKDKIHSVSGYKSGARLFILNEEGHIKNPNKVFDWCNDQVIEAQWNMERGGLNGELKKIELVELFPKGFKRQKPDINFKDIVDEVLK